MPKFLDADWMETSSCMETMNYECMLQGDMSISFAENVEVDGGRTWACPCSVVTWDAVGVEGKHPSLLRLS